MGPEQLPVSPRLAPAGESEATQRNRLWPLEVVRCSLCGIALPLGLLVPDGGQACAGIRWYCKDTLSCTGRWTTARPPGPGTHAGGSSPVPGKRRAARVLTDLLERGDREGLPVLEWTISHNGAQVTGRSYAQPGSARRAALATWAAALSIRLGEEYHQDSRITTITGTAKQERTRHGFATITLTGDIWED